MEFDEMKKIWDTQNNEPLYAINEEALHRSIRSKKKRAARLTNINDFGLMAIGIITAIIYSYLSIINEAPTIYDYLIVATLVFGTGYLWVGRVQRKKQEQTLARTMLGDLDHAISSVAYEMNRSKNMVWWFVLPSVILIFLNMSQEGVSVWKWVGVAFAFALSALILRWDYNRCQKPKKQKLEALREKLIEETGTKPL
ncbi:MAG TPA: hypothetical protein VFG39_08850 [Balneolaceae bacterium]|nr:hypothetical protein [Balneolaceae bacterium]